MSQYRLYFNNIRLKLSCAQLRTKFSSNSFQKLVNLTSQFILFLRNDSVGLLVEGFNELLLIAEIHKKPAGMCITLPNYDESHIKKIL